MLVEKNKEIKFVEPQSMNFDTKVNQAYAVFRAQAPVPKGGKGLKKAGSIQSSVKTMGSLELFKKDGAKVELPSE